MLPNYELEHVKLDAAFQIDLFGLSGTEDTRGKGCLFEAGLDLLDSTYVGEHS